MLDKLPIDLQREVIKILPPASALMLWKTCKTFNTMIGVGLR